MRRRILSPMSTIDIAKLSPAERLELLEQLWDSLSPEALLSQLPELLPDAIAWAEARAKKAAEVGSPLTPDEETIARAVGVTKPELVRIEIVGDRLPMPDDPVLQTAATQAGLLGPGMVGLTLGHCIF